MTTAPPPSIPPPIHSLSGNTRFGNLPPVSPINPGEVNLPDANPGNTPKIPGLPTANANPAGPPAPNYDPPPSFQAAGLANKSAANTGSKYTDNSGGRAQSAISQKTKSIGVAIRAAALAKPIMAGGTGNGNVALHDPDFGIYSHSEQVRQRHYYSRLTLNMIVVLFIGIAVISAWSFWPKLSGWWSGITTTDQQYLDNIIDGLLMTDIQKYDVELETTIDQFGQADVATITGEFITTQSDPLVDNPRQSSIELDFSHQISVATADTKARYETIVLGVDRITNPVEQSRYIRIRPVEFNQNQVGLGDLHQTWAKIGDAETLSDGQPSLLINLAEDLETNYNHYDYTLLLPSINISDPNQREAAKQYLVDNPPYHPFDCRIEDPDAGNLVTCQILVAKDKVQQFYRHLYSEIFETETIPAKYDDPGLIAKLPDQFRLTIDTSEQRPVKLVANLDRSVGGGVSPDTVTINYQKDNNETIEIPAQPLDINSYRQSVRQFETSNAYLFNSQ